METLSNSMFDFPFGLIQSSEGGPRCAQASSSCGILLTNGSMSVGKVFHRPCCTLPTARLQMAIPRPLLPTFSPVRAAMATYSSLTVTSPPVTRSKSNIQRVRRSCQTAERELFSISLASCQMCLSEQQRKLVLRLTLAREDLCSTVTRYP